MIEESDPYVTWDAAYVLGALTPPDRRAYQQHLAVCEQCREAVAELAGVPGMLALVPRDTALSMVDKTSGPPVRRLAPPAPDGMLRRLIVETERKRRRGRLIAIGSAVAAAAAAVAIAVPVAGVVDGDSARTQTAEPVIAVRSMTSLTPTPLSAKFEVVANRDGGSRIEMECQYASDGGESYDGEYAMFLTTTDGVQSLLATWKAQPGDVVTPSATTSVAPDKIRSVDIRSAATNQTILFGTV